MKNERKDLGYELWKLEIAKQQRVRAMVLVVVTIICIMSVINAIIIKNDMLGYTLIVIDLGIFIQFFINIIAEIKCEKECNKLFKEELNKIRVSLIDNDDEN